MKLLFVCTGNTCRSPMAAALAKKIAQAKQIPADITSAGLAVVENMPASENAVRAMAEEGIDLSGHRASQLTLDMIEDADRIICMTEGHADAIRAAVPDAAEKLTVPPGGVSDPYGGNLETYRHCRDELKKYLGDFAWGREDED